MFFSEAILSRRGPLGRVWIAAHMERKLSKTQTLQTDIGESVEAIMGQDMEILALRLSGQLLLGVVRIYSRKARYLLEDCNEALLKIKMAFRPGVVDMGDELVANKNTITIQQTELNMDIAFPDINWEADFEERAHTKVPHGRQHLARADDITLRPSDDYGGFDLDDPFGMDTDGIGSQDFDLGITFGPADDNLMDADSFSLDGSVGVGRRAHTGDESIASHLMNNGDLDMDFMSYHSKSREPSEHPFDNDMNIDMPNFDDVNLGDMGISFNLPDLPAEGERTPGQARSPSRASSPLTPFPETPPPDVAINGELQPFPKKAPKKYKERKQIVDEETELQGGGRGRNAPVNKDLSEILTPPQFLPRSSVVMRLMEIRKDPVSHFLPTKVTPNGTYLCAAPAGLAPELAEMFMQPINGRQTKKRGASLEASPSKKRRIEEEDEVEQARREASLAPSVGLHSNMGRASVGLEGGLDFGDQPVNFDDFQLDVPMADVDMGGDDVNGRASVVPSEHSRYTTPGLDEIEESYADATCPIAMFDAMPSTQSQAAEREEDHVDLDGKGYSKNTVKALSVTRKELRPLDGEDEEKVMSFNKMTEKASRRAAASFFFELLVLGTRDCVKLTQETPFGNIEVRGKEKLWERQVHAGASPLHSRASSRAPSVARSLASTMGL